MLCDIIAMGVIQATRELQLDIPLVVRLQGTNVEEGAKLIRESGLKIYAISELLIGKFPPIVTRCCHLLSALFVSPPQTYVADLQQMTWMRLQQRLSKWPSNVGCTVLP